MKVIRVDLYDDEGPRGTQKLVAGLGLTREEAERICKTRQEDPKRGEYDWFLAVEDDHVLWCFEP